MDYRGRIRILYSELSNSLIRGSISRYDIKRHLHKLQGYVLALYDLGIINQYAYDNYRLLFIEKYTEEWRIWL